MTETFSVKWKTQLDEALKKDPSSIAYSLSTVEHVSPNLMVPRTRTVIHRSFHPILSEGRVPQATKPYLPIFLQTTTDVRSPKASQIHSQPSSVELMWWFPESRIQFRVTCTAYLLPHPSHQWAPDFPGETLSEGVDVDWDVERIKAFNAMSPFLRASFWRPIPGSPLVNPEDAKTWPNELPKRGEEKSEEEKEAVTRALSNFSVLFFEPREVDVTELGVVPNVRTKHKRSADGWAEQAVVP